VVVIYGRSHALPTLSSKPDILSHPFFYFDLLYVHKKFEKGNPDKEIVQVCTALNNFLTSAFDCARQLNLIFIFYIKFLSLNSDDAQFVNLISDVK